MHITVMVTPGIEALFICATLGIITAAVICESIAQATTEPGLGSGADGTCDGTSAFTIHDIISLATGYTMGGAVLLGSGLSLFGLITLASLWGAQEVASGLSIKVIIETGLLR